MRLVGFNKMTESFKNQIYELLEQSKVVPPIKDKQKRKIVGMTKDLQQILSKNEKRVKEDKWDDDAQELRDLIAKQQKRIQREKELGEDVKSGILLTNQKSFKDIITDLVEALKFHQENMKQVSDDYYEYDRNRFVSNYYDRDTNLDLKYSTDLESLATLIVQIHKYNHIIITDGEGKDIRTNSLIDERGM
jgi:hypothetical protein